MSALVLVSALHYKAHWKKQFRHTTDNGEFHALSVGAAAHGGCPNSVVRQTGVRYMELRIQCNNLFSFGYYDNSTVAATDAMDQQHQPTRKLSGLGYRVIEIPYKGDEVSMVIVMPDDPLQLPVYEQRWATAMTTDGRMHEFEQIIYTMREKESMERLRKLSGVAGESVVRLPYFKTTPAAVDGEDGKKSSSGVDVLEVVKALGVTDIFDRHTADLSNITGNRNNKSDNLFVSGIFHKCSVQVDETGTEASAATGAVMELTSLPPPCVVNVVVDRPFIFQIRKRVSSAVEVEEDNNYSSSDLVLFMGRVADVKSLQSIT
eukprot:GHVS01076808.1.p1 GENE.GHVS01076808.1~~GHVS01076808.1.p1  ORF type:complete len:358 (-),score=74.08 GHVS01076808.1:162-1118(-)